MIGLDLGQWVGGVVHGDGRDRDAESWAGRRRLGIEHGFAVLVAGDFVSI